MTGVRGELDDSKEYLAVEFKITYLSATEHLLGVRVDYDLKRGTLTLDRRQFTENVFRAANMTACKHISTPTSVTKASPMTEEEKRTALLSSKDAIATNMDLPKDAGGI